MLDIININPKSNFDYLTLFLVIFTGCQVYIQHLQKNITLFKEKIQHYQNFHNAITDFYTIIPIKWNNEKRVFCINNDKLQKEDKVIAELEKLRYRVNLLKTESKYLFNNEIFIIENKFDQVLSILLKFFFKEEIDYSHMINDNLHDLVENLRKHNEIFDKELDIVAPCFKRFYTSCKR